MNIWLCPVKPRSWRIIKSFKVFGVPRRASTIINEVRPGDLLLFHVLRPVNGIIAICRVTSDVYEDHKDFWGKDRYPLRVRMEFVPSFQRDESSPIPLSFFFSNTYSKEIRVEPYLKNIWITKVSKEQYKKVKELFQIKT